MQLTIPLLAPSAGLSFSAAIIIKIMFLMAPNTLFSIVMQRMVSAGRGAQPEACVRDGSPG